MFIGFISCNPVWLLITVGKHWLFNVVAAITVPLGNALEVIPLQK